MENVEQPNDVHEQNTRDFQFDLPFRISTEMPKHDLKPPDAIISFLTLLVEQTSYGICVRRGLSIHAAASSKPPIHLATAYELRTELTAFVCYDKRLGDSAGALGLPVAAPA